MSTDISEDLDLSFANGSLNDLAMRMGDLDKELDEIAMVGIHGDKATTTTNKDYDHNQDEVNKRPNEVVPHHHHALELSAGDGLEFSDQEDDDGLDDLTKELGKLDAAACQEKQERVKDKSPEQAPPLAVATTNATTTTSTTLESTTTTVTAAIFKPSPDSSVGISMKTSKGMTMIIKITPGGLASNNTELQVGMQIVSIDDTPIRNARHARELIQMSILEVRITCLTTSSTTTMVDNNAVEQRGGETTKKQE